MCKGVWVCALVEVQKVLPWENFVTCCRIYDLLVISSFFQGSPGHPSTRLLPFQFPNLIRKCCGCFCLRLLKSRPISSYVSVVSDVNNEFLCIILLFDRAWLLWTQGRWTTVVLDTNKGIFASLEAFSTVLWPWSYMVFSGLLLVM